MCYGYVMATKYSLEATKRSNYKNANDNQGDQNSHITPAALRKAKSNPVDDDKP